MSFFKKLIGKGDGDTYFRSDIKPLGQFLQRKFSRGVDYNMKLVIRGDRNVGKSILLSRLQGEPFKEEYIPSTEIQVASIHWNYCDSSDVVKVDVWDVVDVGKPRPFINKLKITNSDGGRSKFMEPCLDANFLDVYKGTHGVILMLNMTKSRTFEYVCRELPHIPAEIPVLIMLNFRDMHEHRTVTVEQVQLYLEKFATTTNSSKHSIPIHYCESSMRTGFGLMYLHKFLNIPFLYVRRLALTQQLERNALELNKMLQELNPSSLQESNRQSKSSESSSIDGSAKIAVPNTDIYSADSQKRLNIDFVQAGPNAMVTALQEDIDPNDCEFIYPATTSLRRNSSDFSDELDVNPVRSEETSNEFTENSCEKAPSNQLAKEDNKAVNQKDAVPEDSHPAAKLTENIHTGQLKPITLMPTSKQIPPNQPMDSENPCGIIKSETVFNFKPDPTEENKILEGFLEDCM